VHHSLQVRSVHRLDYVELPAALLDGAPDALRFRAFTAALLAFLSAKKLVIRAENLGHAQGRPWEQHRAHPCPSDMYP
jgi:hypothetical protein